MREALARNNMDFVASAPASRASGRKKRGRFAFLRFLGRRPARTVLTAAFSAVLVGIAINALYFQTARHPAPLFGLDQHLEARKPVAAAPAPAPRMAEIMPTTTAPTPTPSVSAPAAKASGPRDITDLLEAKPAGRDQIAALLHGSAPVADAEKTRVQAAQRALIKLGYNVRADGLMGATTRQAIEKFERDRSLAVTGELSRRTVRELAAQSRIAIP